MALIYPLAVRAFFAEKLEFIPNSETTSVALMPNRGIDIEASMDALMHNAAPYEDVAIRALILETFPEDPRMLQVAIAESSLIETAKNPKSSAKGIFAILDGTWVAYGCTGNVLKAEDNIACAKVIHDRDGIRPWDASGPW